MRFSATLSRPFALLIAICAVLVLLWQPVDSACTEPRDSSTLPARTPLPLKSPVQDKNFYLLSLLENNPKAEKILLGSDTLKRLDAKKRNALPKIFEKSQSGDARSIDQLAFTDGEKTEVSRELAHLYQSEVDIRRLVDGPLRISGLYQKYSSDPGEKLVVETWQDCAVGLNNILSVYGFGKPGRSPAIEMPSSLILTPTTPPQTFGIPRD